MIAEAREYKETQALERQMEGNHELKAAWLAREVHDYQPVVAGVDEDDDE